MGDADWIVEVVVERLSSDDKEAHTRVCDLLPHQLVVSGQLQDRVVEFCMRSLERSLKGRTVVSWIHGA